VPLQIGDFSHLLDIVEQDPALVRQLRDILRFPDDARWNFLVDAVRSSVVVDNRVRAFQCPSDDGILQLLILYACFEGQIDFSSPLGLQSPASPGSTTFV
jgi:hypothetical protein